MGTRFIGSINPAEPALRKDYSKVSIFAYFYPFMPPLMIFGQNLIRPPGGGDEVITVLSTFTMTP